MPPKLSVMDPRGCSQVWAFLLFRKPALLRGFLRFLLGCITSLTQLSVGYCPSRDQYDGIPSLLLLVAQPGPSRGVPLRSFKRFIHLNRDDNHLILGRKPMGAIFSVSLPATSAIGLL